VFSVGLRKQLIIYLGVVHFTFNIPPPSNVNNLFFGIGLMGLTKKQRHESEWEFTL
jgi:hypothetical protein